MAAEATYTHGHHASVLRSHTWRTAENSAGYLLPHLRAGAAVLDLGCGPGTITVDLARRVAPGQVVGVDAAASVVDSARAAAAEAGADNVTFAVGDAYALDFPDDHFDVVHAHQVLQHLGDPVAALREMRRVAKPGGLLAARDGDYQAMTWYPEHPAMDAWQAAYRRAARGNGGEPDAGRRLLSWARAAGLTDVRATASVWCFADEADRAWWGGLWAERVTDSALATTLRASGIATEADIAAMSAAWRAWSTDPDGWFIAPHGEILARA